MKKIAGIEHIVSLASGRQGKDAGIAWPPIRYMSRTEIYSRTIVLLQFDDGRWGAVEYKEGLATETKRRNYQSRATLLRSIKRPSAWEKCSSILYTCLSVRYRDPETGAVGAEIPLHDELVATVIGRGD